MRLGENGAWQHPFLYRGGESMCPLAEGQFFRERADTQVCPYGWVFDFAKIEMRFKFVGVYA